MCMHACVRTTTKQHHPGPGRANAGSEPSYWGDPHVALVQVWLDATGGGMYALQNKGYNIWCIFWTVGFRLLCILVALLTKILLTTYYTCITRDRIRWTPIIYETHPSHKQLVAKRALFLERSWEPFVCVQNFHGGRSLLNHLLVRAGSPAFVHECFTKNNTSSIHWPVNKVVITAVEDHLGPASSSSAACMYVWCYTAVQK